ECTWQGGINNGSCIAGCNSWATSSECSANSQCYWRTDVLPPKCDKNPCTNLGQTACVAMSAKCGWDPMTECVMLTGCAALSTQTTCNGASAACLWNANASFCEPRTC